MPAVCIARYANALVESAADRVVSSAIASTRTLAFTFIYNPSHVPRGRGDKMGTTFTIPAPKKFVTAKNRPKFFEIFDNFRLSSRIPPERISTWEKLLISNHLQPLLR